MKRRSLAVLAVAPAAALVLSSCGGSASPEASGSTGQQPALSPAAAVAQATDTTVEAGTAKFGLEMIMAVDGESFTLTGTGAYDYDARSAELRVDLPGNAGLPVDFGPLEAVIVEGVAYVQLPLVGNGSWIRIDPAQLADSGLVPEGSLELPEGEWGGLDPGSALDLLRGAGSDAVVVGEDETVNGVSTTHYAGSIDLAAAAAELPEDEAVRIPDLGDIPNPTYDIWVDDADHIVRANLNVTVPAPAEAGIGEVTLTVTLNQSEFGEPVTVIPPAEEDVVDLGDALGGLGDLGGLGGLEGWEGWEGLDLSQVEQLGLV